MMSVRMASALLALGIVFAVSACSSAPPPPRDSLTTPQPGATPSATPATGFANEASHPDPNFDTGFTVLITGSGFQPGWLIAPCCQAVTWKNTTSSPVQVVFNTAIGGSGQPIPPGGIYVFVPQNIQSIAYHNRDKPAMKGVVQVNQLPQ